MAEATGDRLIQFLLGRMPLGEREALERECLREDRSAFAELVALEDELRFAYLAGDLAGLDQQTFETRYLSTLSDRARLMFARALRHSATSRVPGRS